MTTNDQIIIRDLHLACRVGVTDAERATPQPIVAQLALQVDLTTAGNSDQLNDTVDYEQLTRRLLALAAEEPYALLERLATRISTVCLDFSRVTAVTVRLDKPSALRGAAAAAAVEITRRR